MITILVLVLGIIGWLACGWLGGRMYKKQHLREFPLLGWRSDDELVARILMLVGLPTLLAVLLSLWFTRHPLRTHSSWFGKGPPT